MSSRSNTTSDNLHFKSDSEYNILRHRPHKTLIYYFNALRATALFRIWPHMLFFAGWSSMVVCLNIPAHLPAKVPTTMITVLGELRLTELHCGVA
jgi:hypothetical protein